MTVARRKKCWHLHAAEIDLKWLEHTVRTISLRMIISYANSIEYIFMAHNHAHVSEDVCNMYAIRLRQWKFYTGRFRLVFFFSVYILHKNSLPFISIFYGWKKNYFIAYVCYGNEEKKSMCYQNLKEAVKEWA